MSQHDYVIANDSGASVRADINSVLQAILSQNSGTSEPTTTSAGTFWLDTTGGAPYTLKIRDAGNNHWLTLASVTDPGADGNIETSATIKGTIDSSATFPAGHILRVFYDESDATQHTFSSGTSVDWDELDVTIPAGASTSDYIVIALSLNGIFNDNTFGRYLKIGLRYSANDWTTDAQLGSVEFYDRPGYLASNTGLVISSHIEVRANHPTTSAYRIRPWIRAVTGDMNVNQENTRSTMTVYEIKG